MAETKLCEACSQEFDWEAVERRGYEYCCEACAMGQECTCPQHDHGYAPAQKLNRTVETPGERLPESSGRS